MAKTKKPNTRGRQKGEQTHFNGMEPVKIPGIHGLAIEYVRVRDARMDLTKEEVRANNLLLAAMQKEGITTYDYDDVQVKISVTQNVSVRKAKEKKAKKTKTVKV